MNKVLLHFVARTSRKSALCDALCSLADNVASKSDHSATVMPAHSEDSMRGTGDMQALPLAFDVSLELLTKSNIDSDLVLAALKENAESLSAHAHLDLSAAMIGDNKVFVESAATPIRFQYCMRRRADLSHLDYLKHYEHEHAKFGIGLHGIEGYVQFHADLDSGRSLAEKHGFGIHAIDSVSELHIADMETFFSGMAKGIDAGNPGEDEDLFVDRRRSVMWVSDEIYRA